ncbi:hypothetical protein SETIT_1G135300v2 [Setaria italica]|uniref:Uncharacterized protein n=1 Tax=Setaria italica TaxID=4555 RepID=A0A368PJV5_SETIT|nr:hypothetical protein SETIT_1G135300v2 [Setaria italica]
MGTRSTRCINVATSTRTPRWKRSCGRVTGEGVRRNLASGSVARNGVAAEDDGAAAQHGTTATATAAWGGKIGGLPSALVRAGGAWRLARGGRPVKRAAIVEALQSERVIRSASPVGGDGMRLARDGVWCGLLGGDST